MIRHAQAAPFPVDPLPVPVIEPSFRAFLVFFVRTTPLSQPRFPSASIPAVDLPPVAGAADGEHRLAPRPPARHLDPHHLPGWRIPRTIPSPPGNNGARAETPGVSAWNEEA